MSEGESEDPVNAPNEAGNGKTGEQDNDHAPNNWAAVQAIRDYCCRKYEQYGGWKKVQKTISVLTVVFVGVYTLLTWRLLVHTQENADIDERAWIEIQSITPVLWAARSPGFGAQYRYNIFPKNVGKTAAYGIDFKAIRSAPMSGLSLGDNQVEIANYQKMLQRNIMGIPEVSISRRVSKTLGPGEVSEAPFDIYGQEPQGGFHEFLIGRVDYMDAFGYPHWRTYCLFVADEAGNLQYCQYGNDVDRINP